MVVHGGDFLALASAAAGNESALEALAGRNLASAGQIRFYFAMFAAKVTLVGVLGWTGCGLLLHWRSARWCALSYCGLAIGVAVLDTVLRLFFLTPPGEMVLLTPIVMDAATILFANVLGGAMFMPEGALWPVPENQ